MKEHLERERARNPPEILTAENLNPGITMEEVDHLKRSNKKVKGNHLAAPTTDDMMINEVSISEIPHDSMMDGEEQCHMEGVLEDATNREEAGNLNVKEAEAVRNEFKAPLSYKEAVQHSVPKEIFFNENVEQWSEEEEEEGDEVMKDSQSFDLNDNPLVEDPMLPVIDFPKQLIKKIHLPWKDCLIVKLLGKTIGYRSLTTRVKSVWDLQGDFELLILMRGFFYLNSI